MADEDQMSSCDVCGIRVTKETCPVCSGWTCLNCWCDEDSQQCDNCFEIEQQNKKENTNHDNDDNDVPILSQSSNNKQSTNKKQPTNKKKSKRRKTKQQHETSLAAKKKQDFSLLLKLMDQLNFENVEKHSKFLIDTADLTEYLEGTDPVKKQILAHLAFKTSFGHLEQMISIYTRPLSEEAAARSLLYNEDDEKQKKSFKTTTNMAKIFESLLIFYGRQSLKSPMNCEVFSIPYEECNYILPVLDPKDSSKLLENVTGLMCNRNITLKGKAKIHGEFKSKSSTTRFKLRKKMKKVFNTVKLDQLPTNDETKWIDNAQQFVIQQVDFILDMDNVQGKELTYEEELLKSIQARRSIITMFEQLDQEKEKIFDQKEQEEQQEMIDIEN